MDKKRARRLLETERGRLEQILRDIQESEGFGEESRSRDAELAKVDQHEADMASDMFERSKDLAIMDQAQRELDDIEAGFRKVDEGTYGACEICGSKIDDERLEMVPGARYCIEDQQRIEREQQAHRDRRR